jgi:thiamine biosynthesis lipoprotein
VSARGQDRAQALAAEAARPASGALGRNAALLGTAYRLLALLAVLLLTSCRSAAPAGLRADAPAPLTRFEYTQPKWGSVFKIVLYAPDEATAKRASDAAFARFDEMAEAVNDYDPRSEISKLSRLTEAGPMTRPVSVSRDLYHTLEVSRLAAEQSGGAFDVTVGPLVKLWRRSRELGQLPTKERLAAARASVGYQHIELARVDGMTTDGRCFSQYSVRLTAPKMRLDLGGIVTGYATQEALNVMRSRGVTRALVDAAGDLAASDPPPGRDHWRVAIQAIDDPSKTVGYVRLANRAVSTSGDTYRFVEIDGVRYSHIIDPKTGLGLTRSVGVTVIADDGITADWLDTAIPVMDVEAALALVERTPGAAARITTLAPDGGIHVRESARFRAFWDGAPAAP